MASLESAALAVPNSTLDINRLLSSACSCSPQVAAVAEITSQEGNPEVLVPRFLSHPGSPTPIGTRRPAHRVPTTTNQMGRDGPRPLKVLLGGEADDGGCSWLHKVQVMLALHDLGDGPLTMHNPLPAQFVTSEGPKLNKWHLCRSVSSLATTSPRSELAGKIVPDCSRNQCHIDPHRLKGVIVVDLNGSWSLPDVHMRLYNIYDSAECNEHIMSTARWFLQAAVMLASLPWPLT